MNGGWILLALIALWGLSGWAYAQQRPGATLEIVADLLEAFEGAQVRDSSSCVVRRPAVAGGVRRDGLFEHPATPERPARVEYAIELPLTGAEERLLLAFDIALADGVDFQRPGIVVDGVRFAVEVEGQRLFEQDWKECRWQSYAVDLTPFAGRRVHLTLLTDAIGTTNFDWALWGNPRILRFRGSEEVQAGRTSITNGALAFLYRPGQGLVVRLHPVGEGEPLEWREPPPPRQPQGRQWAVLDFSFPEAEGVEIQWSPGGVPLPKPLLLAPYVPQLVITHLGPRRALPLKGQLIPLEVEVRNVGRERLEAGKARVGLLQEYRWVLPPQALPALAPGESWRGQWEWKASQFEAEGLRARLEINKGKETWEAWVEVASREAALKVFPPPTEQNSLVLSNGRLRLELVRARGTQEEGYAYARLSVRHNGTWLGVGVLYPLMRIVLARPQGDVRWDVCFTRATLVEKKEPTAVLFEESQRDPEGMEWRLRLQIALEKDRPVARFRYTWETEAARPVRALWGPNLYVGEGSWGSAKIWGLLPGVEYLYGGEPSSNPRDFAPPLHDRRTPHPYKLTIPLMAVSVGPGSQAPPERRERFFCPDSLKDSPERAGRAPRPKEEPLTVALFWNPLQRWDGIHAFPSLRFASPNEDEGMDNHRLGLFLPSCPDFVPENAEGAKQPYRVEPGRPLTLEAAVVAAPGPAMVAVAEWLWDIGGVPQPPPWPRDFERELAVCREGFLRTVWDEKSQKWSHCIGWNPSHAPGFATLLWLDGHIAQDPEGRRRSLERVELAVRNMMKEGGPGLFTSSANCHILRWEFPFLYGYLPEALPSLEGMVRNLIESQEPDGGWRWKPSGERQAELGQAGDSVLGTNTHNAMVLLRYARLTGDRAALEAGERALLFMERFRVPRGGQTWECPMYEPDILPAGWAIAAYLEGYWATGNPRWLHDALYWAETGLPFVYLWSLPDRPMMLGATIPVFGSTFYTHSWLAMPVQWCGLVYAYHLQRLAKELEHSRPAAAASPLTPTLDLTPQEWRRVAELITVSGMLQQFDEGERIGAYPDSITDFQRRNPAFLNPEDILVNVLALKGYDPDIKTVRLVGPKGTLLLSSGAVLEGAQPTPEGVRFRLRFFPGEPSHTLVVGLRPRAVQVNRRPLPPSPTPVRREAGWWWDAERQRLYLVVPHEEEVMEVEILGE